MYLKANKVNEKQELNQILMVGESAAKSQIGVNLPMPAG